MFLHSGVGLRGSAKVRKFPTEVQKLSDNLRCINTFYIYYCKCKIKAPVTSETLQKVNAITSVTVVPIHIKFHKVEGLSPNVKFHEIIKIL